MVPNYTSSSKLGIPRWRDFTERFLSTPLTTPLPMDTDFASYMDTVTARGIIIIGQPMWGLMRIYVS